MSIIDRTPAADALDDFRALMAAGRGREETAPEPILNWLEEARRNIEFESELVGLAAMEGWRTDPKTGNIVHDSGQFFSIEGVHTRAHGLREVTEWRQPIFNQTEGGILALFCARRDDRIQFLLQAKAEPGNVGYLQLAPSIQCTYSNLNIAHKGKSPPLSSALSDDSPGHLIYCARHNEEGGRFWRKSNANAIILFDDAEWLSAQAGDLFVWASLSQIKALCLVDNVVSPFVKTIIAPL